MECRQLKKPSYLALVQAHDSQSIVSHLLLQKVGQVFQPVDWLWHHQPQPYQLPMECRQLKKLSYLALVQAHDSQSIVPYLLLWKVGQGFQPVD
ncbi:hypothetical protein HW115_06260 [Verrucomicrobiaceae bacterium N1E253]|uniref:Uncharacterized protein n=1 Tax=Oceaniferula marina TaxID=2748318 RepID=A0A851GJ40_9BACT|nr:hypothetical protein [Oceaniferula marina]NWK55205.1 hypothetical protein [Oceaniferula marina]